MTFTSRASTGFWKLYAALPNAIQEQTQKQYAYRALAVRRGDAFHWFWIGTHDEYERIINE